MARIQVLPLPVEKLGPAEHTPYILIIDQTADDHDQYGARKWGQAEAEQLTAALGAMQVLVVEGDLTVANVDEKLHKAAQAAVERALCPAQSISA